MLLKNAATRDLPRKERFEAQLERQLAALDREVVNTYVQGLIITNTVIDVESRALEPLTAILIDHYHKVGRVFSEEIRPRLPEDVEITNEEIALIVVALAGFFTDRAAVIAPAILDTTRRNLDDSWIQAQAMREENEDRADTAVVAGVLAARKLRGRRGGIARLETETPAEAAKNTEAEVLARSDGLSVRGESVTVPLRRRWDAQGDQFVRDAHVLADGQIQIGDAPFQVGGELLRWPKDTSLGATIGNVAGCRCATFFVIRQIVGMRRAA